MFQLAPNACSDVSKYLISITIMMTLDFSRSLKVCVPSIQFTIGFASILLYAALDSKLYAVMQ